MQYSVLVAAKSSFSGNLFANTKSTLHLEVPDITMQTESYSTGQIDTSGCMYNFESQFEEKE